MDLFEEIKEQGIKILITVELFFKRIFSKKLLRERIIDLIIFSYTSRKKLAIFYLRKYCNEKTQLEILMDVRKTFLYQNNDLFLYLQKTIISQLSDKNKQKYFKNELENSVDYLKSQWFRSKYIILFNQVFSIQSSPVMESIYSIALERYKTILHNDADMMFNFTKGWNFTRGHYCVYGADNSFYFINILGKLFIIEKFKKEDRVELFEMAEILINAFSSCLNQLRKFGVISEHFKSLLTGHLAVFLENAEDSNYNERLSKLNEEYVLLFK
ncbi:MAG: hypothetical protein GY754_15890 [bacterium]|nr:hypothetical protein [bacterium]